MAPFANLNKIPSTDYSHDPYTWEGETGWRAYRSARPFRGMYYDIKRRLPWYYSDIVDGFNYRTFAGTIRIFFVNLLPALAFQLDMTRNTDGFFGINEALFSSALAAVVFSTLSCQPLTVVGITGLISLFNYTIYDITVAQGISDLYPQFIAWVSIWAAITHWAAAIFNWCDYMRYITDFSSQSFGTYVGIIYIIKGVEELVAQFEEGIGNEGERREGGYFGILIALMYWFTVYMLEKYGSSSFSRSWIRKAIADYAYPIATIWWTGFSHIPGRIADTPQLRIPHTTAFYPTVDRSWLIPFWELPVKWVFVALPIGILLTLLFYYDHNVSSLTAQAKQFPLTKPAGFHWDFFLLGVTCFIAGIIGIPLPNGLVPQAPVHTDSCTVYEDKLKITKEKADDDVPEAEWEQHNRKIVEAVSVKEQRVSHWLMALALIGTMTGPLLDMLHTMPRSLFSGVFFVVGSGSVFSGGLPNNVYYLFTEKKFVDPGDPRLKIKKSRIALYISFQWFGVLSSVAISQTIAAIGFPVIIVSLIPLRWIIMPRIFTEEELLILDAPTAEAAVVLASMGGQPTRPEVAMAEAKRRAQNGDGEEGNASSSTGFSGNEGMRSRGGFKDNEEKEIESEEARREREEGGHSTLDTRHA
ncbi:uncharacterized protein LTR77_006524 [Saxophila tyrrhenica]|uniref:Bicarbonate transporter-like transmembrane domain-containing protein n=1 Tax=Saxophila tyrrhenica TaxID=1690608 RepID=A0AAV9P543_9PEZI|nr:hypothetical protein LTR77_006524 [Saxophila tyrrhenica]